MLDIAIVIVAFLLGTSLRAGVWAPDKIAHYSPAILLAGLAVGVMFYISGLYALHHARRGLFVRFALVGGGLLAGLMAILVYGSVDYSARIGRGVLLISAPLAFVGLALHHYLLHLRSQRFRERLACLAASPVHESEAELFESLDQLHTEFVGMISVDGYRLGSRDDLLGDLDEAVTLVEKHRIDCLLCPPGIFSCPEVSRKVRRLRYAGITVLSLADICEEFFQAMPLELTTPEWLLHSSGQPRLFYVKKLKRAFDIIAGGTIFALLLPIMLAGMLAVRFSSRGPIFFRQARLGRFGREFEVIKLRTMRTDAEKDGPQWAQKNDARTTAVGKWLRKFRIDEIPQLWCVLKGDMSFVGPRPERAEFVDQLAPKVPYFRERLMVQPGLTGWAQVNYPYGANAEDARRKLEYDLYYMKHMGLFLDFFILLDTVRIVFLGGAPKAPGQRLARFSDDVRRAKERERAGSKPGEAQPPVAEGEAGSVAV